jgi:prephenate dehydrogenase
MGGSLGLAIRDRGLASRVIGYDANPEVSKKALRLGAVTEVALTVAAAVAEAGIVVIAAPAGSIPEVFAAAAPHLRPGAVVTDVGSTKSRVVEEISKVAPDGVHFIGGHPIAGSEREGIDAASADLYEGCFWILTPTSDVSEEAYSKLVKFVAQLGGSVLALEPARHDALVALTSHLPQLLSSMLMGFAAEITAEEGGLPLVTAGGFRDMTRIAASSPDLWVDIIRTNRAAILAVLDRFAASMASAAAAIEGSDWGKIKDLMISARRARQLLSEKPGLEAGSVVELEVAVPDRPGVLAEVTTTVGEAGVNIEDLDIVHSPEGGRGTLRLEVKGLEAAKAARDAIEKKGFAVELHEPER